MTATIALPRQPHSDWLARLRTISMGLAARRGVGLGVSGRPIAPWFRASGAPLPVAVYQPLGAASLDASYINLVNPGTYDAAPGVTPTLDASGWAFSGTKYLLSGIVPTAATTAICRFSNASGVGSRAVFGIALSAANPRFFVRVREGTDRRYAYGPNNLLKAGGALTSGVVALAAADAYLNGTYDGSVPPGTWLTASQAMAIGAERTATTFQSYFIGHIQALVIYHSILTASQVAAVSAAMAAL